MLLEEGRIVRIELFIGHLDLGGHGTSNSSMPVTLDLLHNDVSAANLPANKVCNVLSHEPTNEPSGQPGLDVLDEELRGLGHRLSAAGEVNMSTRIGIKKEEDLSKTFPGPFFGLSGIFFRPKN